MHITVALMLHTYNNMFNEHIFGQFLVKYKLMNKSLIKPKIKHNKVFSIVTIIFFYNLGEFL
jgi:hypothetical protein